MVVRDLTAGRDVSLVLAGGAALGAYHMGVWQGIEAAGIAPGWVVGASVGAITAAIILGNPEASRMERLAELWAQAAQPASPMLGFLPPDLRARLSNDYALAALLYGRPGLFAPRWPGGWSILPFMPRDIGLRDASPLRQTLLRLIDFDRLNAGKTRLSVLATDVETGADVWFDTQDGGISVDHLMAATALMPIFPPVRIGAGMLCDAGLSKNLPLDRICTESLPRDMLCIAADLFQPQTGVPETLDEVVTRAQDLAFFLQSKHSIEALQTRHRLLHRLDPDVAKVTLGYTVYHAAPHERSLKALDFSDATLGRRAKAGRADVDRLPAALQKAPADDAFAVVTADQANPPVGRVA